MRSPKKFAIRFSVSTFVANSLPRRFVSTGPSKTTVTGSWTCYSIKTPAESANARWPTILHGSDVWHSACSSTIPAKTATNKSNKPPHGIITSSLKYCFFNDQTSRPLCSASGPARWPHRTASQQTQTQGARTHAETQARTSKGTESRCMT